MQTVMQGWGPYCELADRPLESRDEMHVCVYESFHLYMFLYPWLYETVFMSFYECICIQAG